MQQGQNWFFCIFKSCNLTTSKKYIGGRIKLPFFKVLLQVSRDNKWVCFTVFLLLLSSLLCPWFPGEPQLGSRAGRSSPRTLGCPSPTTSSWPCTVETTSSKCSAGERWSRKGEEGFFWVFPDACSAYYCCLHHPTHGPFQGDGYPWHTIAA